jgi:two-component system, NtrC family, response regulator AtoC
MSKTMLIIDDEVTICQNLKYFFTKMGFTVDTATDGESGIQAFQSVQADIVLLDLKLPDMSGLEVLQKIKNLAPGTGVIMITAYGEIECAVQAMKLKADNFLLKPVDLDVLENVVVKLFETYQNIREIHYLKQKISRIKGVDESRVIRQPESIFETIRLLAANPTTTVLILGETGTGKGVVAQLIHDMSTLGTKSFVDVNCAGLSVEFLETELFGHERGAFTDAKTSKRGLLEIADGGSLFLDEVGELTLPVQAKLLKVIEEKSFRRLGGTVNIKVDVRIMAATSMDLSIAVNQNLFRKDLLYRLNVMPIHLPPLRQQQEIILLLANDFIRQFSRSLNKKITGLCLEAETILKSYGWPGNIRELRNVIERAVLLCDEDMIRPRHLPENMRRSSLATALPPDLDNTLSGVETRHIAAVLTACNSNHTLAAKMLGIHRTTLLRKMKQFNLR